jgi:outer membrane receptor protein involved in Fe transport
VLLNGEPLPRGFSIETLSPELIERVEVLRGSSVEWSAQGIAGSINFVTRRAGKLAQREAKASAGTRLGRWRASADLALGDKLGDLTWGLSIAALRESQRWPMQLSYAQRDAAGQPVQAYGTRKLESSEDQSLSLAPRASWRLSETDSLSTDHLLRWAKFPGGAFDERQPAEGSPPPALARDDLWIAPTLAQWRGRLNWTHVAADGGKLELRLGGGNTRRNSAAHFLGWDASGAVLRDATVDSLAVDQNLSAAATWRRGLGPAHTLLAGLDADVNRRTENRLQHEQDLPGGIAHDALDDYDQRYDARVWRMALYAQDEWQLSEAWTASLGLRLEALRTESFTDLVDVLTPPRQAPQTQNLVQSQQVPSPVLRAVWQVPGAKDQLKLGFSRAYRAPNARELMPRRYVANDTTAVTPNEQGNPSLKPELAWSLDAAWEHPLPGGGQWVWSAFAKRVDEVLLDELFQQDGAWTLRKANSGRAMVLGTEFELRGSLAGWWPGAPAVDTRANLALNHSRLSAVSGPDSRMPAQAPWVLNLGGDHRWAQTAWAAGASVNAQGARTAQLPTGRSVTTGLRHGLDAYVTWRQGSDVLWRGSLANVWGRDEFEGIRVQQAGDDYRGSTRTHLGATARVAVEVKL